ncbi:UPF0669 protein C6orf120 homolog,UPF0669 protein v1g209471 [Mytilus edulis]|uniref:UPF0669 protein C6orf120 homolog,UPF0669 protein v1g209471 n=1 Tax=Mytilus edulis TaxID=6550 RepID=A0A8S3U9Q9_MYTED|nr:UPF0669 protein C6orf120 homolog,UPF0669 protein v1g209471 [Mytilus edulis]
MFQFVCLTSSIRVYTLGKTKVYKCPKKILKTVKTMDVQHIVLQFLLWANWGLNLVYCEHLLQTLTATIGAENYTHYRLSTQGRLHITLESIVGDADLYISDNTLSPNFEDYVIQSNTCGMEEVEIPSTMKRPVGIGIYGHPNYKMSEYRLSIYFLKQYDDANYAQLVHSYNKLDGEDNNEEGYQTYDYSSSQYSAGTQQEEGESAWSVIGTILSTILKIIFEILL